MRQWTLFLVVPGVTLALGLTACGTQHSAARRAATPTSVPTTAVPTPSRTPQGPTELTVVYQRDPHQKPRTWHLTCDPVGGDHPNAVRACAILDRAAVKGRHHRDPFAPTPAGLMCSQLYGGPEVSHVTGIWRGKPVKAEFNRANGCEIARWDSLAPLLGELPRIR